MNSHKTRSGIMLWKTHLISVDAELDVLAELPLEGLGIFLLQRPHVIGDMIAEDVRTMNIGVETLGFIIVARKTLGGVRNVQTAIDGTLHGSKNTSTSRGTLQTHVQVTPKRENIFKVLWNSRRLFYRCWENQRHTIIKSLVASAHLWWISIIKHERGPSTSLYTPYQMTRMCRIFIIKYTKENNWKVYFKYLKKLSKYQIYILLKINNSK